MMNLVGSRDLLFLLGYGIKFTLCPLAFGNSVNIGPKKGLRPKRERKQNFTSHLFFMIIILFLRHVTCQTNTHPSSLLKHESCNTSLKNKN